MSATLDVKAMRARLRTRVIARRFIYRERTGSTMDDAREAALAGAAAGTAIFAEEQSAGRGTHGRGWVSPPGQNIYCTIVLRPTAQKARRLSMVTPVGIANAVEQILGLFPRIKWPNDLRLSGKKFAGILIETEWSGSRPLYALVGVGINVNFDPAAYGAAIAQPATSLALERGRPIQREPLLAATFSAFERAYESAESDALFDGWRARLETLGRSIAVRTSTGALEGVAEAVAEDGSLLVRRADGVLVPLSAAEVMAAPGDVAESLRT